VSRNVVWVDERANSDRDALGKVECLRAVEEYRFGGVLVRAGKARL
jgi:hypothetical protein